MKSYTDLEQSKKLAEILPIGSADMIYPENFEFPFVWIEKPKKSNDSIPCWSLAALLIILPQGTRLIKSATDERYHCDCPKGNANKWFDNPIDAVFEMICLLKENGKI